MPDREEEGGTGPGLLRALGGDLRPGEGRLASLLTISFFLVVSFQYVAKTVRQSTFVDSLGAVRLPYVYLLVALISYPLLKAYVRLASRFSRLRLITGTCGGIAASLGFFWWAFGWGGAWAPVVFYVWTSLAFVTLVSQFWGLCSFVLDARQAKRLFALIGAGGLLGSVAGGQLAGLASRALGVPGALGAGAFLLVLLILLLRAVHSLSPEGARAGEEDHEHPHRPEEEAGLALIFKNPHLRLIALLVVLGVVAGQAVDLQFNWAVERATSTLGERLVFFGNFYSAVGVAALIFQLFFTGRILKYLGVGAALRFMPVALFAGSAAVLASFGFAPELLIAACLGLKVGESGLRYSLDQSGRELLYLPVARRVRLQAKALIDILVQRSAKGFAALLLLPVAAGLVAPVHLGWLTGLVALIWMGTAARVYTTYVAAFRSGLKDRTVESAVPIDIADVRTVEILIQSLGSADARQVLHSLEILEANNRANLIPPLLLYHDDPAVRKRTLQVLATLGRRDASPLIERRLSDHDADVRAEAIRVLTEFNPEEACRLMLPRLRESDPRVRAAAVTCLLNHGNEDLKIIARRSLRGMLSEDLPELRAEAVRALGAVRGSEFEGRLMEALEDPSASVGREAIASIRRLVARDGFQPIFVPKLVSLLGNRRLKHDARNALVVFGQEALPALVHFMNDPGESIAVRRALPRVIARIGGGDAVEAILAAMSSSGDIELKVQLVEALSYRRRELLEAGAETRIEEIIENEVRAYMIMLSDLVAIGGLWGVQMDGIAIRRNLHDAGLLTQILAERLEDQLKSIFGLLAIIHDPSDLWASYRSLKSGQKEQRAHALEFLDNTLSGGLRLQVFSIIDESPISDKLRRAYKDYDLKSEEADETLSRYIEPQDGDVEDGVPLAVAGIYTVYSDRITKLYPAVRRLAREAEDGFVKETAAWVEGQLPGAGGS